MVRSVKLHSTISFTRREIVDWTYLQDGRMQGNFTACAILKSEPPEERAAFMKHFGLRCDD